jgi:hypothetical protein
MVLRAQSVAFVRTLGVTRRRTRAAAICKLRGPS